MAKIFQFPIFILMVLLIHPLFADGNGDSVEFVKPSFKMSQEITRIEHAANYVSAGQPGLNKAWVEPTSGSIDFQVKKNERLALEIMLSATYYRAPYQFSVPQNFVRNIALTAPRLYASYTFGDLSHPFLKADMGVFNYKYNENSRNLGEYMFRTWAYPGIIYTGGTFNYVGANSATVTGFKLSQTLGMFSHDLMLSLETDLTPVYDLNLTYMAKFNVHDIFKIGGGVQLARMYSDNKDPLMTAHYFQENGVWYAAGATARAYYMALQTGINDQLSKPGTSAADSVRLNIELAKDTMALSVLDSVSFGQITPQLKPIRANAVKPVAYFSFDPKPLLGSSIFGAKDLILYGEVALLGVKNFPVYYDDMMRRMPMMIGFNFPTFKVLDVLSLEMEYYGSRWLPTYPSPQTLSASPTPIMSVVTSYYPTDWDKDNWKWSVYAERVLIHGLTLSGQFASDHSRSWDWNNFGKTPWENYTRPSQWYWSMKLGISI